MLTWWKKQTIKTKLFISLLALGLILGIFGNAGKTAMAGKETKELAMAIASGADHVIPDELAQWIIEGKTDFRLIDIREPWEFDDYHIKGAENIPLATLFNTTLPKNKKYVLYSGGEVHAGQAWIMLKVNGYDVYMLKGGIIAWWDEIMTPVSLNEGNAADLAKTYPEKKHIRNFFLGAPSGESTPAAVAVQPTSPEASKAATPKTTAGPKKKKEGC
jgi:rhodanese-related sulfurtransferase